MSVVVSDDVTAGMSYKSGWSAPKFETDSKPSMDGVELSGSYDGGVDLSYAVNMLGCPVVDGSFGGGASVEGKATFRPTGMGCVEAEAGPYCSLAVGKHSWVGDLFGLSFEKKFKGGMSKVHFENGSFVSKCTWNEEVMIRYTGRRWRMDHFPTYRAVELEPCRLRVRSGGLLCGRPGFERLPCRMG